MKNYTGKANSINYTAGADISSGEVVVVNDIVTVAAGDIANGSEGVLLLEGEFEVAKQASLAINQGDQVFWDAGNDEADKTGSNVPMGVCTKAAAESDTKVRVKLHGNSKKQAANVAALAQDISNTYVEAEVQAISTKVDAILTSLKNAGLMKSS